MTSDILIIRQIALATAFCIPIFCDSDCCPSVSLIQTNSNVSHSLIISPCDSQDRQTTWCIAQITDQTIYSHLLLNNGPNWSLALTPPGFPCGASPVAQRWRIHLQCRSHQEMWVWSLGQEDPLKEGMGTHFSILPGKAHAQRSMAVYSPQGHIESNTPEVS